MSSMALALRNRALLVLMLGHFTNDMFGGVLPMLFPTMQGRFDLSNAQVGLAATAYTGMASLTQPLFGHLVDRWDRRWFASVVLLWHVVFVAAYGFAPSWPVFLLFAGLAGIASGAYHPLGASNASLVSDDRYKNGAMSLYTVGGTSGWALGPLVAVALLALFGPRGTAALVVPGALVAALIFSQMRFVEQARRVRAAAGAARTVVAAARPAWSAVARVVGVTMLRSWAFFSVVQFIPLWYADLGYSPGFYGPLVTTIILAGAVGTLLGGALADRLGQRRVIVGSLALAIPALLLFVGVPGPWALLTGALFGVTADASLSVTLVMAQKLVPGRVGVMSGVILGLGFITGGIGVPLTGRLADAVGIQIALGSLGILAGLAALLALTIPREVVGPGGGADEVVERMGHEAAGASPGVAGTARG